MKKILIVSLILLCGLEAEAQLTGSVSVQGEYEPLVIETERLNAYPQGFKFELPASRIDYALDGIVTDFRPSIITMGTTGRQTSRPWPHYRGWLDVNMGSYLNTNINAGYYILSDARNTLLADVKYHSTSLYRIHDVPPSFTRPTRKHVYDGRIGLTYSRLFGSEGLLEADAGYRLAKFNYYGTTTERSLLPSGKTEIDPPTQTLNQVDASVNFTSSQSPIRGWHVGSCINYFGYRRLFFPIGSSFTREGSRETTLKATAGYSYNFAGKSAIAIDAKGDFIFFSDKAYNSKRNNYGVVSLLPSYRFVNNLLSLRAGANIGLTYDAMDAREGKKFGHFHIAPDIDIAYSTEKGQFGIFLKATGGIFPSTLQHMERFDRYQMPIILNTVPVYSPIDARLGINIGPFTGFSATVGLRYASAKNVPLGGWYQEYLKAYPPIADFNAFADQRLDPYLQTVSLHGMSVELGLQYAFGTMAEVKIDGIYTPQDGKKGIFNGFDRPRWILNTTAAVRPIKKLKIHVGYDYRGVRNCYRLTPDNDASRLWAMRLPDLTLLNAKITYSIHDNFDIYCSGENLLNRHIALLPGLQQEGIVISGGFYLEF